MNRSALGELLGGPCPAHEARGRLIADPNAPAVVVGEINGECPALGRAELCGESAHERAGLGVFGLAGRLRANPGDDTQARRAFEVRELVVEVPCPRWFDREDFV